MGRNDGYPILLVKEVLSVEG